MQTIDPDILISLIIEESEHRSRKETRNLHSKQKAHDGDEALAVAPGSFSSRGRGNWRNGQCGGSSAGPACQHGPCWNCGSRDHFKSRCPKPDKSASQGTTDDAKKDSANAATFDSKEEGAFSMVAWGDLDDDFSVPDLLSESSDGDDKERWNYVPSEEERFSEMGDTDDGESLPPGDNMFSDVSAEPSPDLANLMHDGQISTPIVELHDSGSMRHIFPYKDQFMSLTSIPLKTFLVANKQSFNAIATGDLIVDVPNGCDVTKLRLMEVLYSPAVGYTLVSIGRLDQLGYSITFGDGTCTICSPDDDVIGRVPKTHAGLYHVIHTGADDGTNAAVETMTIMELHRRMGHILPIVARRLAENGLVSSLKFDLLKDEPTFCEACVYAKATRKPIAKERVGKRATEFGAEVHMDVWGPAPVETIGGRRYYITFTDDKTRLMYLHLLRQKSKAFAAYQDFEAWCRT